MPRAGSAACMNPCRALWTATAASPQLQCKRSPPGRLDPHRLYGRLPGLPQNLGRALPGGPDAYVREWAQAGRLMGVDPPPLTEADMRAELDRWYESGQLRADHRVAETVEFIRKAPLHPMLRPGYRVLFAGAVYSLEPRYRAMLGLLSRGWAPSRCRCGSRPKQSSASYASRLVPVDRVRLRRRHVCSGWGWQHRTPEHSALQGARFGQNMKNPAPTLWDRVPGWRRMGDLNPRGR